MTRALIEVHEGRVAGALLDNGLLEYLTAAGGEVQVVTPGARVPAFVDTFARPGVSFTHLPVNARLSLAEGLQRGLDRRFAGHGFGPLRRGLWRAAEALASRQAQRELALLRQWRPDVVVASHVRQPYSRCLVAAAHRLGIPTVGNLFSWDNAHRALSSRPRVMTCWSQINRRELIELWGFPPERTVAIGAPMFDAYFGASSAWSRERLCAALGLDARRPLLLFASLGQIHPDIDETSPFETLLATIDSGMIPGHPQVVLRLHPTSRAFYFSRFTERPDVVVSRYSGYHPGLGWYPSHDEMVLAGNLFRHADVVVSPGSTVTLEAAIFDTPTVVPVFNEYMPQEYDSFFTSTWLQRHFRPLVDQGLLVVSRTPEETAAQVRLALAEPQRGQAERGKIRQQFLDPLDGRSTERLAGVILDAARQGAA